MSEYMLTTDEVRGAWRDMIGTSEQFDNWLARVKADVQADMRAEFVASADVLYFNGGYRTINRGMVERVARESSVPPEPHASVEADHA